MQTADPNFIRGMRFLLAARRIETCEDDYARRRLEPLAEDYRERAAELMAMMNAPALGGA